MINKITITIQERYEGAYMNLYVGKIIPDQTKCITSDGTYTFSWSNASGESGSSVAIYIKAFDSLPETVKVTVDKVTLNNTEYSGEKLPANLYKDGKAVNVIPILATDGAVWYNAWNAGQSVIKPLESGNITEASITVTVTGFPAE